MKSLAIEWKRPESQGRICDRCSDTGQGVREVAAELKKEIGRQGVDVSFTETKLGEDRIPESNHVLPNGVLLEDLLPGARTWENACCSCTELLGVETWCGTATR
jgi:hypothetical protein